jgi:hypothetical protein
MQGVVSAEAPQDASRGRGIHSSTIAAAVSKNPIHPGVNPQHACVLSPHQVQRAPLGTVIQRLTKVVQFAQRNMSATHAHIQRFLASARVH